MSTLKGDLIPYLINKQFVKPPQSEKKDQVDSLQFYGLENQVVSDISDSQKKGIKLLFFVFSSILVMFLTLLYE